MVTYLIMVFRLSQLFNPFVPIVLFPAHFLIAGIKTRNVLHVDCDQSSYSWCIIFSYTFTLERLDKIQDGDELDWTNGFRGMAIQNYTRRLTAAILDFVQPQIAPFDLLTS